MTKSLNFFNNNNFSVKLHRLPDVELFCQNLNLPGITLSPITPEGHLSGYAALASDSSISIDDLSLTFIVDENLENYISVLKWLLSIAPDDDLENIYKEALPDNEDLYSTDISVFIKNNNKQNIGEFIYKSCIPYQLSGVDLNVTEGLTITAQLTFKLTRLDFEFKYSKQMKNSQGIIIPSQCLD